VDRDGHVEGERRYWQLAPDQRAASLSFADATAELGSLLEDSVRIRLRSDVPVGTSLSGGIDSSLVAAIVARLLDPAAPRQRTFSARHRAAAIDEGAFIAPVVAATRAQASEVWIDPNEVPDAIERLVWHQDEPFPHTSMFAQWKVYELARREGITVLLDGQGADEIFGGYHSLAFGALWYGMLRRMDVRALADEIGAYRGLHGGSPSLLLSYVAAQGTPTWLQARARAMRWHSYGLVANLRTKRASTEVAACIGVRGSLHRALCAATLHTSLPGLLRFADRSSMAHSLEVRLPFLDHRVVEFAFGLSDDYLVHRGWSKRILRELLRRDLPQIADRRDKIGFATPEGDWFRGPLHGWMTDLLTAAGRRDIFQRREVEQMWQSVLAGRTPTQVAWRVANVELWLRRYADATSVSPPDSVPARS
jgi:asparagine synthase (glutamine-hydrolysing)